MSPFPKWQRQVQINTLPLTLGTITQLENYRLVTPRSSENRKSQ
jgi:hypothetical protein